MHLDTPLGRCPCMGRQPAVQDDTKRSRCLAIVSLDTRLVSMSAGVPSPLTFPGSHPPRPKKSCVQSSTVSMWRALPGPLLKVRPIVALTSTHATIRRSLVTYFPRDFSPFDSLIARIAEYKSVYADDRSMACYVAEPCLAMHWPINRTPPLVDFRVLQYPALSESEHAWAMAWELPYKPLRQSPLRHSAICAPSSSRDCVASHLAATREIAARNHRPEVRGVLTHYLLQFCRARASLRCRGVSSQAPIGPHWFVQHRRRRLSPGPHWIGQHRTVPILRRRLRLHTRFCCACRDSRLASVASTCRDVKPTSSMVPGGARLMLRLSARSSVLSLPLICVARFLRYLADQSNRKLSPWANSPTSHFRW